MRDAAAAEMRGLPTVVVVTEGLCSIAGETAKVIGLPDLAIVPVDVSLFGLSRAQIADAVRPLGTQIAGALCPGA